MKFIIDLIKANTDEDGKVDVDAVETLLKTEFPKNAVPKDQYNTVAENLKTANGTLEQLQKDHKDTKELQDEIEKYKTEAAEKDAELVKTRNESSLREALREAGAEDIDYALFKLGDLETDSDGNYKNVESAIKNLKESNPKYFGEGEGDGEGSDDKDDKGGFKPVDNGLKNGKPNSEEKVETLRDAIAESYKK